MAKFRCVAVALLLGLCLPSHAEPSVQVGFSPEGSARQLVLETIGSAEHSIHMLAYAYSGARHHAGAGGRQKPWRAGACGGGQTA